MEPCRILNRWFALQLHSATFFKDAQLIDTIGSDQIRHSFFRSTFGQVESNHSKHHLERFLHFRNLVQDQLRIDWLGQRLRFQVRQRMVHLFSTTTGTRRGYNIRLEYQQEYLIHHLTLRNILRLCLWFDRVFN